MLAVLQTYQFKRQVPNTFTSDEQHKIAMEDDVTASSSHPLLAAEVIVERDRYDQSIEASDVIP